MQSLNDKLVKSRNRCHCERPVLRSSNCYCGGRKRSNLSQCKMTGRKTFYETILNGIKHYTGSGDYRVFRLDV